MRAIVVFLLTSTLLLGCKKEDVAPIKRIVEYKLIDDGSNSRFYNITFRNETGGTTSISQSLDIKGVWSVKVSSQVGQTFYLAAQAGGPGSGSQFQIQAYVDGKLVQTSSVVYSFTTTGPIVVSGEVK
jgi:hypothetical protein